MSKSINFAQRSQNINKSEKNNFNDELDIDKLAARLDEISKRKLAEAKNKATYDLAHPNEAKIRELQKSLDQNADLNKFHKDIENRLELYKIQAKYALMAIKKGDYPTRFKGKQREKYYENLIKKIALAHTYSLSALSSDGKERKVLESFSLPDEFTDNFTARRKATARATDLDISIKYLTAHNPNLVPVFITLTIPNCEVNSGVLKKEIEKLNRVFTKIGDHPERYPELFPFGRPNGFGYYRHAEVTVNCQKRTLHPHVHGLLLVDKATAELIWIAQQKMAKQNIHLSKTHKHLKSQTTADKKLVEIVKKITNNADITQAQIRVPHKKSLSNEFVANMDMPTSKEIIETNVITEVTKYTTKFSKSNNLSNGLFKLEEDGSYSFNVPYEVINAIHRGLFRLRCNSSGGTIRTILKDIKSDQTLHTGIFENLTSHSDAVYTTLEHRFNKGSDRLNEKAEEIKNSRHYINEQTTSNSRYIHELLIHGDPEDKGYNFEKVNQKTPKATWERGAFAIFNLIHTHRQRQRHIKEKDIKELQVDDIPAVCDCFEYLNQIDAYTKKEIDQLTNPTKGKDLLYKVSPKNRKWLLDLLYLIEFLTKAQYKDSFCHETDADSDYGYLDAYYATLQSIVVAKLHPKTASKKPL